MHRGRFGPESIVGLLQVEDTPQSEMIRTYVKLQEGDIIEGDKHTSAGIGKALEKCAAHAFRTRISRGFSGVHCQDSLQLFNCIGISHVAMLLPLV